MPIAPHHFEKPYFVLHYDSYSLFSATSDILTINFELGPCFLLFSSRPRLCGNTSLAKGQCSDKNLTVMNSNFIWKDLVCNRNQRMTIQPRAACHLRFKHEFSVKKSLHDLFRSFLTNRKQKNNNIFLINLLEKRKSSTKATLQVMPLLLLC